MVAAVVDRTVGFPDGPAGVFVQSDDVLHVAAIDVDEEQVLEQDRRRTGAFVMVAIQVAARPQNSAARRVQASRAVGSEMDIHAAGLDRGRRRGITVDHADVFRLGRVKNFDLSHDFSALAIHTDREHLGAVRRSGREPDLVLPDDRRGPAEAGERRLPGDVLRFAPRQRQPAAVGVTVPRGPAELGPGLTCRRAHRCQGHGPESDQLGNHRLAP